MAAQMKTWRVTAWMPVRWMGRTTGKSSKRIYASGLIQAGTKADAISEFGRVHPGHGGRNISAVMVKSPKENPSASIRAQVRRLPSGEVQIKVPLRKGENPMAKAQQVARALGRKVTSVARVTNGRVCNPSRGEVDKDAARELELFIENDADLYRQQYSPINKNLAAKKARGIYRHDLAVKLFMYLMESGAKKYARQFGGPGVVWSEMFNVPTRRAAAERFADYFETEYDLGNYDRLLPKKYQKK